MKHLDQVLSAQSEPPSPLEAKLASTEGSLKHGQPGLPLKDEASSSETPPLSDTIRVKAAEKLQSRSKKQSVGGNGSEQILKKTVKRRNRQPLKKGLKKQRLTPQQICFLELRYQKDPDWQAKDLSQLAKELNFPRVKIYKWHWDRKQRKSTISDFGIDTSSVSGLRLD